MTAEHALHSVISSILNNPDKLLAFSKTIVCTTISPWTPKFQLLPTRSLNFQVTIFNVSHGALARCSISGVNKNLFSPGGSCACSTGQQLRALHKPFSQYSASRFLHRQASKSTQLKTIAVAEYGAQVSRGEVISLAHHQSCCLRGYWDQGCCCLGLYFSHVFWQIYRARQIPLCMINATITAISLGRAECWSQLKWVFSSYGKYNFPIARQADLLQAKQSQIENMCFD